MRFAGRTPATADEGAAEFCSPEVLVIEIVIVELLILLVSSVRERILRLS